MNVIDWVLQTDSGIAGLLLRLTLAVVIFPHGAQKALGWFGGHGFKGTMKYFTSSGIPAGFALLAIAAEFLGPLGLAVGLLTRVAAFGIACVMLVAIITVHWPHGFFINWYATKKVRESSTICSRLGIAITLIIVGAGSWSLDNALANAR
ncbi:MAG: DoxX family protein [Candidatus Binatia bacterium]